MHPSEPKPAAKKNYWAWLGLWLIIECVSSLLLLSTFLANSHQASAQGLLLPLISFSLVASLVTIGYYRLWRRQPLVGLVAAITTALVLTSDYDNRVVDIAPVLRALSPSSRLGGAEMPLFSLALIVLVVVGSYWLGRLVARIALRLHWNHRNVYGGVLIAIVVVFAFNFIPTLADVVCGWAQFFYQPPALAAAPTAAKATAKPDIYYIVLDRYASNDILKSQFGYDNSGFLNSLRATGYYVNDSAHNNYPYTTMSIASTMAADYDNDIINHFGSSSYQTTAAFNETIRQSPVAQRLKTMGYQYDLVGNWYETSNLSSVADQTYQRTGLLTVLGHTYTLDNLSKNYLTQSVWWQFIAGGLRLGSFDALSYENLGDVDMHHYELNSLKTLANAPAGGRFVFAHILLPHDPYYFQADGSISNNPSNDNVGELIKQKYLGQLQYANGQIKDILATIKKKSGGQAVVILQADEGPYPNDLDTDQLDDTHTSGDLETGDMTKWSAANLRMKYGNLAAYYVPKANFNDPATADAADNVNIFRLVLDTYFGYQLPTLPDCYYAYPNGRDKPINFANINQQLTGQPADPRCLANGTVRE